MAWGVTPASTSWVKSSVSLFLITQKVVTLESGQENSTHLLVVPVSLTDVLAILGNDFEDLLNGILDNSCVRKIIGLAS
jgi:uncharacterized protein YifN (PemK superfamily)